VLPSPPQGTPLPLVTPPTLAEAPPNLAVSYLTVARPDSSIAVRPQPMREHEDTGGPGAENPHSRARHGVNRPRGMHLFATMDPRDGFRLIAWFAKL